MQTSESLFLQKFKSARDFLLYQIVFQMLLRDRRDGSWEQDVAICVGSFIYRNTFLLNPVRTACIWKSVLSASHDNWEQNHSALTLESIMIYVEWHLVLKSENTGLKMSMIIYLSI